MQEVVTDDNDDNYPRPRVKKEELYSGCIVFYKPDLDNSHFDPSFYEEELPVGSVGIYIGLGSGWKKFVKGHEPVDVLFGAAGRIVRVYMDEIEKAPW